MYRPIFVKPLSPTPLTFPKTARDPFDFLASNGRLIDWARSFSDPLPVTDITIMGGRSRQRLTRIAGRDVRLDDGHTVGKTFVRKVQGSMRGGRCQRFGCERSIDFQLEGQYKKAPYRKRRGEPASAASARFPSFASCLKTHIKPSHAA